MTPDVATAIVTGGTALGMHLIEKLPALYAKHVENAKDKRAKAAAK